MAQQKQGGGRGQKDSQKDPNRQGQQGGRQSDQNNRQGQQGGQQSGQSDRNRQDDMNRQNQPKR